MAKTRRNAHIGLGAAVLLLAGCLAVLFTQDRAAANNANASAPAAAAVTAR